MSIFEFKKVIMFFIDISIFIMFSIYIYYLYYVKMYKYFCLFNNRIDLNNCGCLLYFCRALTSNVKSKIYNLI